METITYCHKSVLIKFKTDLGKDKFSSLVNGDYKYWRFISVKFKVQHSWHSYSQDGQGSCTITTIRMVARQMHLSSATSTAELAYTSLTYTRTDSSYLFYDNNSIAEERRICSYRWKGTRQGRCSSSL